MATQTSVKPPPLSPTLKQMCVHTQTLFHTRTHTHTHTHIHTSTQVQLHSPAEREGNASKGSVWTVAATTSPHPPARLRLPWANEAMISGVFIKVAIVQIHKVRDFFCLFSSLQLVLITSEFSQPPRSGSPCGCAQLLHSGNHRDSRVCQSNDGWHRTGCRSDSQNLE